MVLTLLWALILTMGSVHADEILSANHECTDHPEVYHKKIIDLDLQLVCQTSRPELCRLLNVDDHTAGSVGVAVAIAKAVAVNRAALPFEPPMNCQAPSTLAVIPSGDATEAMLSPFLGMMQLWLASSAGHVKAACRPNQVAIHLLEASAAKPLRLLQEQSSNTRNSYIRQDVNRRITKLKSALHSLQGPQHIDDHAFSDVLTALAAYLSDADFAVGSFRWVADAAGFAAVTQSPRQAARLGLQWLARSAVVNAATGASETRADLMECDQPHSMYGHVDENCKYLSGHDRRLDLFVTAPLETQLYEIERFPQLCSQVTKLFDEMSPSATF